MITEGIRFVPDEPYEVTRAAVDTLRSVLGGGPPSTATDAPPTFVNVVLEPAVKMFVTSGEVPASGAVHTSESVTYTRPLRVGDVVNSSVEVVSVRARASVTQFETLGLITDLEGQEVARVRSALMFETQGGTE